MVRAEDPGKLSTTATVNIKVTDINDNNPKFDEDSYLFHVKEGNVKKVLIIRGLEVKALRISDKRIQNIILHKMITNFNNYFY